MLMPHLDAFKKLSPGKQFDLGTVNTLAMQMNTNHCHVYNSYCEYLSLCKDGRLASGEFEEREVKHVEL
jgi:hypothetical protein